jgi:rhodanese-related sulfurtransferase
VSIAEISPQELQSQLASGADVVILDVREPWELALCAVPGAIAIPMNEVPQRLAELDRNRPIAVMCHHGARSLRVAHFLAQQGFPAVSNLSGGIDAWREQIDPSMRPY